jgi:hypothetical protein
MPARGRNRVEWLRHALAPHYIMTDSLGYPIKMGDTVYGQSSHDPYRIEPDDRTGRKGKVVCIRKSEYRNGHRTSIGVARDGKLSKQDQMDRRFDKEKIDQINYDLKKEFYLQRSEPKSPTAEQRARLDAIKAKARKKVRVA